MSSRFLSLLVLLIAVWARAADDARKPNIIVVMADQWRAQAFGYTGDPNVQTPTFDRFAKENVRFSQAVAGMPVCSPTRASFLTGQRPLTHGIFMNDVPLNPEAVTLPKVLAAAGYETGAIGKWHVDGHGRSSFIPRERRQGFTYWKVGECTHNYNKSLYHADLPERLFWEGYDAAAQTADAQQYVKDHAKTGKPFFLYLAWGPPHNPYETAPEKYRAMYSPEKIVLRGNVPPEAEAAARKDLAGYYAHCTALDDCFAGLLQTLKDTGAADHTIIVFTSDHGDMLGSQGQARKQRPFDESVRVPMIVHVPVALGVKPAEFDAPISSEDLMPTLLGLSKIAIPPSVEGLDFSGQIRGGASPSDGAAIISCAAPFGEWKRGNGGKEYRALKTARYTYARDLNGPWLLFDNQTDPWQKNNLAGQAEHAELQAKLDAWLQRKLTERHDDFRPGDEYIKKWGYQTDASGTVPYSP